ncbi:uncharacterized protein L969DRAFT_60570 [Mixia osmundae IAM 14324]|uniref:uncharacterized protein n=1 Tax=Mixia osmundae (strain CBS 9802 / IAM 14324 / JCM 22182 / KY 12970) TaxID=764103 RepID=UPI0004A55704|nr:uncharacterized protein L969DRAFT_60570 [Mixia osmundae IAM 14324]KEI39887.1 hypothetical protein L969DRAFT_60570 [Mixia osmundae IAM 14324]
MASGYGPSAVSASAGSMSNANAGQQTAASDYSVSHSSDSFAGSTSSRPSAPPSYSPALQYGHSEDANQQYFARRPSHQVQQQGQHMNGYGHLGHAAHHQSAHGGSQHQHIADYSSHSIASNDTSTLLRDQSVLGTSIERSWDQLRTKLGQHLPMLAPKTLLPYSPAMGGPGRPLHRASLTRSSIAPVAQTLTPSYSTMRFVALCSLWYASSAASSNTGKSIMKAFRYPVTLTLIQFGYVAGYCLIFLAVRETARGVGHHGAGSSSRVASRTWGVKKPSRQALHGTLVMSGFQIAGHVFSSMAIARVPVSTVHTIKALSPLFTVASYAVLFRVRYSPATYAALLPLTLGVMLACSFDVRANAPGLICALGSTLVFVSQNIFSKKLLPKDSSSSPHTTTATSGKSLDKLNLLLYSSGFAFVFMIPIWLYSDFGALLATENVLPGHISRTSLFSLFWTNGTVHFAQNLLAFSILAKTSPVTYSIASLVKRIAVICLAIIWSGQHVYPIQALGMTMTFVGLWMYNRAKGDVNKGERKRGQVEKRMELLLPTNANDLSDKMTPDMTRANTPVDKLSPQDLPPYQPPSFHSMNGNGYAHANQNPPPASSSTATARPMLDLRRGTLDISSGGPVPTSPRQRLHEGTGLTSTNSQAVHVH